MFRLQNMASAEIRPTEDVPPGMRLRRLRETLGFTIRDVESASHRIAGLSGKTEYCIPLSRLSDIESKNVVPGVHKLCSLALIYRRSIHELLAYFEIDLPALASRVVPELPWPRTGRIAPDLPSTVDVPIMDPGFNPTRTGPCLRHIQKWGVLPAARVKQLAEAEYTYASIGDDDRMMYPIVRPGALLQIDPRITEIETRSFTNEYERPIYLVETRDQHYCCWVSKISVSRIVLQPHPLSGASPIVLRFPDDAEIIGRVVGVAMRFDTDSPAKV
jgi:transcriptional regulator with XRE-family HTH domain